MYAQLVDQAYQRLLRNTYHTVNDVDYFCKNCSSNPYCNLNIITDCWDQVFFHQNDDNLGSCTPYACSAGTDYYLCKFACRFIGEIFNGLKHIDSSLNELSSLKILSLGCGPCTELPAVFASAKSNSKPIKYCGVDLEYTAWKKFHNCIKGAYTDSVDFIYMDCFQYLSNLLPNNWSPNIIIINYLISAITDHAKRHDLVNNISFYFKNKCPSGSILFLNDINTPCFSTDFFDELASKLDAQQDESAQFSILRKGYFYFCGKNYTREPNHYASNFGTVKAKVPSKLQNMVNQLGAHSHLSSAQLIIRKN